MMVPLDQIATITMGKGPAQIQHMDGKRMVVGQLQHRGPRLGREVTADAVKLAKQIDFPDGYGITLGGASRDQAEVFSEMFIALIMGIALMYLVLVMQFGSFTAPLPVMMSLPLSLIGVVLALRITGGSLNLMSFIGVIMLMGLVAKNAILLLDCARKEEAQGVDREEALMHAGRVRLRPILMTTFALIAGMMPVAIGMGEGGEFYRPMAVAIIGGTITSTLLTLLVVPTFYDSIQIAKRDRMFAVPAAARSTGVARLPPLSCLHPSPRRSRRSFSCIGGVPWRASFASDSKPMGAATEVREIQPGGLEAGVRAPPAFQGSAISSALLRLFCRCSIALPAPITSAAQAAGETQCR